MTIPTDDVVQKKLELLFAQLASRSSRTFEGYDNERTPPCDAIPGELAFFLDDLIERAARTRGQELAEAMTSVVELGIAAWYAQCDDEGQRAFGIDGLDLPRFRGAVAVEAERSALEKLRAELGMERQKNARLQRELEEIRHAIADDPSPAEAQQRADAIASGGQAANYTPMTLHLLNGAGGGNGQQKKASGRFWNGKSQSQSQSQSQSPQQQEGGRRRRSRGRHR